MTYLFLLISIIVFIVGYEMLVTKLATYCLAKEQSSKLCLLVRQRRIKMDTQTQSLMFQLQNGTPEDPELFDNYIKSLRVLSFNNVRMFKDNVR